MRSENTDKFKEILTEAINLTENLRTAVEGSSNVIFSSIDLPAVSIFVSSIFLLITA